MGFYDGLKYVHITTALLSISLFALRAGYLLRSGHIPRQLRYLPHINDSLLFGLGVWMLWYAQYDVLKMHWLMEKFVLIVVYILLGMYSLKWARDIKQRLLGMGLAILTFVGVLYLAFSKHTIY